MRRISSFIILLILILGSGLIPESRPVQADATINDAPTMLVGSGVTTYTLAAPKVFWNTGVPPCPPNRDNSTDAQYTETLSRIATYGSTVRQLYAEARNCGQQSIQSNLASDGSFVYWLDPGGLMKLPTDANPGDAPQLVNALVKAPGEVVDGGDRIYVISNNYGGSSTEVAYVLKSNNQKVYLATPGNYTGNLSTDGTYVYYLVSGNLIRQNPGVDGGITVSTGVSGYYAEGSRLVICNLTICFFSNNVYVGKGTQVFIYNNKTNTLGASPIYTSPDSTARVFDMVTDYGNLFVFENRATDCSQLFCSYIGVLNRMGRGGGSVAPLYTSAPTIYTGPQNLTTDGTYLFWQEGEAIQRLPNNASALPQVNMYVTGMEVTQGIQNLTNSVLLIKNKPTYVRVYVNSVSGSVSGVGAQLASRTMGGATLAPVNPVGTHITVRSAPNRNDLNQSFLFQLPWSWTQQNSLQLDFTLNPYKVPLEPNYGDNTQSITVNFNPSPSLSVEFFRLNYTINNTTYSPRIFDDVMKTYSWILRAYPLGGTVGGNFKPRLWDVAGGTRLGSWVNRTSSDCTKAYPNANDDTSLCASYYTNGWLFYYRIATMFGILNVGLNPNSFYYGMISDTSNNFPRGQAMYSQTSVGPAGTPGQFFGLGQGWDTDGSYADWYAAHEIGHSLGRAHPNAGSDNPATSTVTENCGHSRSDPSFPYGNTTTARAPIGPADNSMEGFDRGDPTFGIPITILPSSIWNDVMSYCSNQWLSDYTYTGMYNYMIAHPSLMADTGVNSQPQTGDFLAVSGLINPTAGTAGFAFVRRLTDVVNVPVLTPGDYTLRLLDAQNHVLADHSFTAEALPDDAGLSFGQVVTFEAGTRTIQIVRNSDQKVMGSVTASANAPVVSDVVLEGAPGPISGMANLSWTASDADHDTLTYDVAYSRDNGATFQPVAVNITDKNTVIDTDQLGGSGQAILRVTASDGVNSGWADSAPFTMTNKLPQPYILTPADNTHIHYGQLVNFSGMALDVQDGTVDATGLVWKDSNDNQLATGPLLSLTDLPVGANVITLQATNSVGETASVSVTVNVDDDLSLPGPTLVAGPSPVGWQVSAGDSTVQTADVSISNAGSGDLNWNAASDQGWLTVSAPSGTVAANGDPSTLTLSADPSGLAAGTTYTANVTITKPADGYAPEQTITIPVTLSVGDVAYVAPQAAIFQTMYLPLLSR